MQHLVWHLGTSSGQFQKEALYDVCLCVALFNTFHHLFIY